MEDVRSFLIQGAETAGLEIPSGAADSFQRYAELLTEWNQKMNLTTITEPNEIAVKHFLDSLFLQKFISFSPGAKVIDVGTGAGFPGIPLKIVRPDLKLTLLDSLNKRLIFLKDLTEQLGVEAKRIHARAEEAGRKKEHRTRYAVAVSRAVARLPLLCEFSLPFVEPGGLFAAMKGPQIQEELSSSKRAIRLLGCEIEDVKEYALPDGSGRSLVLIRRTGPLQPKYPRAGTKIAKNPL